MRACVRACVCVCVIICDDQLMIITQITPLVVLENKTKNQNNIRSDLHVNHLLAVLIESTVPQLIESRIRDQTVVGPIPPVGTMLCPRPSSLSSLLCTGPTKEEECSDSFGSSVSDFGVGVVSLVSVDLATVRTQV